MNTFFLKEKTAATSKILFRYLKVNKKTLKKNNISFYTFKINK